MKYIILVLVFVFAVWQVIGLVKTIKDKKNKKSLTDSGADEDKEKNNREV